MKWLILILALCSAPSFAETLPALKGWDVVSGQETIVSWQEKKGTVLVFISSLCPCSNAHIEHLKTLAQKFPAINFVGIHSNADENAKNSKEYFAQQNLPFPVLRDEKSIWANRLKAYRTPHSFLISPAGAVIYQGGVTSSAEAKKAEHFYLQETLDRLLAGKKIETNKTRVIGCEIARN